MQCETEIGRHERAKQTSGRKFVRVHTFQDSGQGQCIALSSISSREDVKIDAENMQKGTRVLRVRNHIAILW